LLFCINIIGLGLGPFMVGVLSDMFSGQYGTNSLRYALISVSLINIWGAWHYFIAGRHLPIVLAAAKSY